MRSTLTLVLAMLLAWLAGCAQTPVAYRGCAPWSRAGNASSITVTFLAPELADMIGLRELASMSSSSGTLDVRAAVYNCTEVDVALLIRARFDDGRGHIEPAAAWRTVILPPRGTASYADRALSRESRRVALDVQDAQASQTPYMRGQTSSVLPGPAAP